MAKVFRDDQFPVSLPNPEVGYGFDGIEADRWTRVGIVSLTEESAFVGGTILLGQFNPIFRTLSLSQISGASVWEMNFVSRVVVRVCG